MKCAFLKALCRVCVPFWVDFSKKWSKQPSRTAKNVEAAFFLKWGGQSCGGFGKTGSYLFTCKNWDLFFQEVSSRKTTQDKEMSNKCCNCLPQQYDENSWRPHTSIFAEVPVVLSASCSHFCNKGFSLHIFLKLSCRASNQWFSSRILKQTTHPVPVSYRAPNQWFSLRILKRTDYLAPGNYKAPNLWFS